MATLLYQRAVGTTSLDQTADLIAYCTVIKKSNAAHTKTKHFRFSIFDL